jgi:UDP-glucuronate decarboxylase
LFYQYGPFEDERRLMPSVICSLLQNKTARTTKGEQIRDFLHVEDVASALWAVAQSNLTGPVNIGSGKLVTVRAIITTIAEIIGKPGLVNLGALPYGPSDPMFVCANNHRLVENTTWAPRFELEDGLRQTIEWWEERLRGG